MAIADRVIRAARLDVSLYEEVEAHEGLTQEALAVVVLSAVAAGLGASVRGGLTGLVGLTVAALVSWIVWAYLTYWIGTRLLPEPQTQANPGQLLRTIGFASSPGLIRVLGLLPGLTSLVFSVAAIWMLIATVVAVRQALDYTSTWRAIGVVAIGWVIQALVLGAVLNLSRAAA